ncbi:HAMP domain-containing sensor histidine kinase [Streptomyces mirabilis]|uniref:HAMP domain-containing sensor histidine kinase n=1 Tax=Streptomyces mirabilis TaxID=68239 RepID=UPI0036DE66E8
MGVGTDGHDRSTGAKLTGTAASPQLGRAGGTGRDGQKNVSLFRRIFLLNAAGLTVATALLLGPVTVSTPILPGEVLVVVAGLAVLLVVNALVLRIGLAPLQRLGRAMATADLLHPGARAPVTGPAEVAGLITTYNTMLDRLETERATSSARALSAQEGERRRISQELHDEVGQTLTAVLLQLKRVADQVPGELREEVRQAQEATRGSLDEIRRIARRLRPGVLEELGLHSALRSLAAEFTTHGLSVRHHLDGDLPPLTEETELVVYRVAQEGLTNTARHAGADRAELRLRRVVGADGDDGVELLVRDNGKGPGRLREGAGISGMRERALLIGAALSVGAGPGAGTDVRLRISTKTGASETGVSTTGASETGVPPQFRAATAFEGDR